MILFTLGTTEYPFNRLIWWIKDLVERNIITEDIFIQHGASDISCLQQYRTIRFEKILSFQDMVQFIQQSRVVISHAGQGSTRLLTDEKVNFALVPRLSKYGEHVDDHQWLFAQAMSQFGVKYCLDINDIIEAVNIPPRVVHPTIFSSQKLAEYLIKTYP
ncbi:MAG: glycosyl transferase [Leptolyngbya sp. SIO3F4]|nr:glycosyl transferase [Leptolyngbya sp. SIO3F4]